MNTSGASGSNVNGDDIARNNYRMREAEKAPAALIARPPAAPRPRAAQREPNGDGEGDGPAWHWVCVNGSIPQYDELHADLAEHMKIALAEACMCPYCGKVS